MPPSAPSRCSAPCAFCIPIWLTSRERRVLEMRYGLCCGVAYPQHEVARVLGISRSYVSRIEKKALEKLRAALEGVSNP